MKKYYIGLTIICFSVLQSFGQAYPDRHTTNIFDGWISCEKRQNPNSAHGMSHWIMYDFGQQYSLHDMTIWNMNHPEYVDAGLKNIVIEYSNNGTSWNLADTITLPRAPTSGLYEGAAGIDLNGQNGRYLLITALNNHGGGCYGLSEIRIFTDDVQPNSMNLNLTACESDGMYKNLSGGIQQGGTYSGLGVIDNGDETFDFDPTSLGPGSYTITYDYSGGSQTGYIDVLPCTSPGCPACPECDNSDVMNVTQNPIPSDIYSAHRVFSGTTVNGSSDVSFMGYLSVELNPGFEVQHSGNFLVDFRHCDVLFTTNGNFENGESGWTTGTGGSASINFNVNGNDPYEQNMSAVITVSGTDGSGSNARVIQNGHSLVAGRQYEVSFYAKKSGGGQIEFVISHDGSPWTWYEYHVRDIGEYWDKYTIQFEAEATVSNALLFRLHFGRGNGTYEIDDVRFVELN